MVEHFRDSCGGVISWLDSSTGYTAFSEGWALYAENPLIARDTDTYKENLFQKYGMLKWQVCYYGNGGHFSNERETLLSFQAILEYNHRISLDVIRV